jgi:hypothetical protein
MSLREELQDIDWLEPWAPLPHARAVELTRKLTSALGAEHLLRARQPEAVAARVDTPDTLFWLREPEQLCLIHLVKPRTVDQSNDTWPPTTEFDSVQEFIEGCMQPDHAEENDGDV